MTIPSYQPPVPVDYLSMDGQKRTLAAPPGVRVNDNVKAVLIDLASDCACVVCLELFEKSLQTRCCKTILCAQCYEGINVVKKCPQCNTPWQGGISRALQVGDRHINKQVEAVLKHFQDTVSTEQDIPKAKCQVNALKLLSDKPRKTGDLQTLNNSVFENSNLRLSRHGLNELKRLNSWIFEDNNLPAFILCSEMYLKSRISLTKLTLNDLWRTGIEIADMNMTRLNDTANLVRAVFHSSSDDAPTTPHVEPRR